MTRPELHLVPTEQPWRERAACLGIDPELFFPERGGDGKTSQNAKATCAVCPVRVECLETAIEAGERYGVWGGMNYKERVAHKRTMEPVARKTTPFPHGTTAGYKRHRRAGEPACTLCLEANAAYKRHQQLRVVS
jgi:WhiB family redox-sensing transcriptional regulator